MERSISCEMSSNSKYVYLEAVEPNVKILPGQRLSITMMILPRVVGYILEIFIVNFGNFKKKCRVNVTVHDNKHTNIAQTLRKKFDGKDIILGQKI